MIAFAQEKPAHVGAAKLGCRACQRVHDGFEIERRAADDLEHVGGRGLLLQRLLEIARLGLHLVGQADVFDCDHGLVGEHLQQAGVLFAERPGRDAGHRDDADGLAVIHQRREQHAAIAARPRDVARRRFELGIGQFRRRAGARQLVGRKLGERGRERGLQHGVAFRVGRREGSQINLAVAIAEYGGREAADQAVGAMRDGVEHRLHVGR